MRRVFSVLKRFHLNAFTNLKKVEEDMNKNRCVEFFTCFASTFQPRLCSIWEDAYSILQWLYERVEAESQCAGKPLISVKYWKSFSVKRFSSHHVMHGQWRRSWWAADQWSLLTTAAGRSAKNRASKGNPDGPPVGVVATQIGPGQRGQVPLITAVSVAFLAE
jgi:hypothetical protein